MHKLSSGNYRFRDVMKTLASNKWKRLELNLEEMVPVSLRQNSSMSQVINEDIEIYQCKSPYAFGFLVKR